MLIFIIIQYVLLNHIVSSIVILPFEITGINFSNKNYSVNSLINDLFYVDIYTMLYIGTPPQEVLTLIRPDNNTLFLNSKDCQRKKLYYINNNSDIIKKKSFNNKESSSFRKKTTIMENYYSKDFNYLVSETISFYNSKNFNSGVDLKNIIKFDDFKVIVEKNYNNKLCCRLGIGYSQRIHLHIINQLKKGKKINNYLMTMKFTEEEKGILTFGGNKNNSIHNSTQIISVYTESKRNVILPWSISFIRTYFMLENNKEILVQKYALCYLVFNFGLIKGTEKYKNFILINYFQELINKNICKMEITEKTIFDRKASSINCNGTYTIFTCDKELFKNNYIKKFPSFKLKHEGFNYTFELTYKDLFKEINNKYYFLIIFPGDESTFWIFGIPFLKKYEFIYNYDSYTIGFSIYNENKKKVEKKFNKKEIDNINESKNDDNSENKNYTKIFIEIIFCILLIIVGYFIGKKIHEQRKKRANELKDDNYDYFSDINSNKFCDKSNTLIKQNYITSNNISNKNKILEMSIKI